MKILAIYEPSGPKYHRLLLPLSLMPGVELKFEKELTEENSKDVDIVFFNRLIPNVSINIVAGIRQVNGFKLVVDFDDHWILDKDHVLYETYRRTEVYKIMCAYIVIADAITVTHERLANEVRELNENVHILPNAIPKFGQFLVKKIPSDVTRLFWSGSNTHEKDIELLRQPVRELKGLPIQMVLGGYTKHNIYYKIRNHFTNYGKLPHELVHSLPVSEYYYLYSKCDIALIPLVENKFNSFKSNLKVLEAANVGANVIVSQVDPYLDLPYVNYVQEPGDWVKHIKWLLDNPDEAKQQANQLQQYCWERFDFVKINQQRKELFDSLCK